MAGPEVIVKSVKLAELKNRPSHHLRLVQRGEPILVCDRDRAIARIERVEEARVPRGDDAEWLERRGVIRRGTGVLDHAWVSRRPAVRADVVAALLGERDEGP
jgi:antitoxin (DNA-binding transcriptional repressor) of toxin-antitoxin stability system